MVVFLAAQGGVQHQELAQVADFVQVGEKRADVIRRPLDQEPALWVLHSLAGNEIPSRLRRLTLGIMENVRRESPAGSAVEWV